MEEPASQCLGHLLVWLLGRERFIREALLGGPSGGGIHGWLDYIERNTAQGRQEVLVAEDLGI
jgi:hypothetical protein